MEGVIHIPLTKNEVLQALKKALNHKFIDNLRNRHINVELDNKLRGYVGELAFKKWSKQQGITFKASNIMQEARGMDVDFVFEKNGHQLCLELKTSLIPDADEVLERSVEKRDIKLIRRGNKTINELSGDVHIQFFFKQLRLRKDKWLAVQKVDLLGSLENIYKNLAAYRYESDTYFVAWIDKETLIQQLNKKAKFLQKWKYGRREFWCCNLQVEAKRPINLVDYLKNYSG